MDKIDCFILSRILEDEQISTWKIAKLYNWEDKVRFENKKKEHYFYLIKTNKINGRLESMKKMGLIEGNKDRFVVDDKQIKIKVSKEKYYVTWIISM